MKTGIAAFQHLNNQFVVEGATPTIQDTAAPDVLKPSVITFH
jgi:hypothetical protein